MSAWYTFQQGYGYWDLSVYPIGGDFRRAAEPFQVELVRELKPRVNGCDVVMRGPGGNLACKLEHCKREA